MPITKCYRSGRTTYDPNDRANPTSTTEQTCVSMPMQCAANGANQIDATPATDRWLSICSDSGREGRICLISYVYVSLDIGSESSPASSPVRQLAVGIKYLRACTNVMAASAAAAA